MLSFATQLVAIQIAILDSLLQVFHDGEFERLGSSRTIQVNVWVIAAINRDLES